MMKTTLTIFGLGVALAAGACGSADDDARAPTAQSPRVAADLPAMCAATYDLFETSDADLGVNADKASQKDLLAALSRWYSGEKAGRLMDRALAAAPAEIKGDLATLIEAARGFGASGDPSGLERPRVEAAQARFDRFESDQCPRR